ncbi:MAG: acyltransferase, partial [Gemmatimonadetes bacterium]|nr:acyltransferase [Gemmatimonadota bacterium]
GVDVFFVLSGYLITSLVLAEVAETSGLSVRRFWGRRIRRLVPALVAMVVGVVAAALALGWPADERRALAIDATATLTWWANWRQAAGQSYWDAGESLFRHAWSLSIEEQFYLLWPVAFTLLAMRGRVRWVVAVLALGPISRLVTWRFFPSWQLMIGETFPTIADALASGVLLAIMRDRWHAMPSYRRLLRSGMLGLLPLGILLLNKLNAEVTVFGWLLGETMINFAIVLVIDRVSSFPDTLSARFLNLPPMVFLGHLSYSLYLWQQPFLPAAPAWVGQTFPVNIGLLFLAALASFYLIEQPFLRLKARVGGSVGRGARG